MIVAQEPAYFRIARARKDRVDTLDCKEYRLGTAGEERR